MAWVLESGDWGSSAGRCLWSLLDLQGRVDHRKNNEVEGVLGGREGTRGAESSGWLWSSWQANHSPPCTVSFNVSYLQ